MRIRHQLDTRQLRVSFLNKKMIHIDTGIIFESKSVSAGIRFGFKDYTRNYGYLMWAKCYATVGFATYCTEVNSGPPPSTFCFVNPRFGGFRMGFFVEICYCQRASAVSISCLVTSWARHAARSLSRLASHGFPASGRGNRSPYTSS